VWKKLNSTDTQRLKELNDYTTRTREEFYRGFEAMDKLRRRLKKAGDSGLSPSTPNVESSGQTPSIPEEIRREPHPAEDAAEFMRCLNIICDEGDALSRQATASFYYNEMTNRRVSDVLREIGLLAMELQGVPSQKSEFTRNIGLPICLSFAKTSFRYKTPRPSFTLTSINNVRSHFLSY
jgi:hypothetical protein